MNFLDTLKIRRSQYALKNTIKVSEEEVVKAITESIKHTPSAYNTQTTRAVILLGENHEKLWNIVKEVLLAKIGPERFVKTEAKIDKSFLSGYGTVLFFIDEEEVEKYAKDISEKFYSWANESAGMVQINVWNAISSLYLGASLQHYNPIIDDKVRIAFDIPKSWKLISQMPFGDIAEVPGEKEFKDTDEIVRIKK